MSNGKRQLRDESHMAGKTWLRAFVLALCGIIAAAAVSQVGAQTKDKIPVNPTLSVKPPEGALVLFGGKAEQMRDNWYARRSTNPSGWTVDDTSRRVSVAPTRNSAYRSSSDTRRW